MKLIFFNETYFFKGKLIFLMKLIFFNETYFFKGIGGYFAL